MPCITFNLPPELLQAQTDLAGFTDKMLALSGESCNLFGILGLKDLESKIHSILGVVGNAMGAVNDIIATVQNLLNSVLDTALAAIAIVLDNILGGINKIIDFAQSAVNSVTGMIDDALGLIGQSAGVSELLACAGVLGQVLNLPSNVTSNINKISGLLSGGTPITDIANAMIAEGKGILSNKVDSEIRGLLYDVTSKVNDSQDLINLNLSELGRNSCVV
jgi:hypothetical protein